MQGRQVRGQGALHRFSRAGDGGYVHKTRGDKMDAIEFARKYPSIIEEYRLNRSAPPVKQRLDVKIEKFVGCKQTRAMNLEGLEDDAAEIMLRWSAANIVNYAVDDRSYEHGNELAVWSGQGVKPTMIIMDYEDSMVYVKFSNGEFRFTMQYNDVVEVFNSSSTCLEFVAFVVSVCAMVGNKC